MYITLLVQAFLISSRRLPTLLSDTVPHQPVVELQVNQWLQVFIISVGVLQNSENHS
jgi:hypothetical protein